MGSDKRIQAGLMYRWAPRNFPDKVAAICGPRRVTYRELDEAANRLANALRGLGLESGDRVAVLLHNSIETLIISLAIERAGLAFVRLSPQESPELWNYVLEHSEARAMLMDARFVEQWKQSDFGRRTSITDSANTRSPSPCSTPPTTTWATIRKRSNGSVQWAGSPPARS